jgi:hypothetical protein
MMQPMHVEWSGFSTASSKLTVDQISTTDKCIEDHDYRTSISGDSARALTSPTTIKCDVCLQVDESKALGDLKLVIAMHHDQRDYDLLQMLAIKAPQVLGEMFKL